MSDYIVAGSVITIDLEDGQDKIIVDVNSFKPEVQDAGKMFGFKTVLRNTTAGKMDEPPKARAAMLARIKLFQDGMWESEATARAAVELSDEERGKVIGDVIVLAKKAKGDARSPGDILRAFNALPEEQRSAAVASLQKMIDKKLKDALRQKRTMAKQAENSALATF